MEKGDVTCQIRSQDLLLGNIASKFMQGCVELMGLIFSVLSSCQAVEVPEKCLPLI
jgi:hypothetical protein